MICNSLLYRFARYFSYALLSGLALLAICALIPRKWSYYPKTDCDLKICIANTGIHSNIIVPTENNVFDWHKYLSIDAIGIDAAKDYNYLSFGWGDRDFYMLTYILHHCQKPGLLRISKAEILTFSFTNPVSLTLLRMVQDLS